MIFFKGTAAATLFLSSVASAGSLSDLSVLSGWIMEQSETNVELSENYCAEIQNAFKGLGQNVLLLLYFRW